ncbi:MAG: class I SAM-dependent methyltransferase [Candidatus Promineifilaceae bacterium]
MSSYNFEAQSWFEQLYLDADNNMARVPWSTPATNPHLQTWLTREAIDGTGKTALVIGCGLGDDAEALADYGFAVTAFDISETAIQWAKQRFPQSSVQYQAADMFAPLAEWVGAFDFVLEINIVQALPLSLRDRAISAESKFVAPHGHLLIICFRRDSHDIAPSGPPWALSRVELNQFEQHGLTPIQIEAYGHNPPFFRAHYSRSQLL